MQFRKRLTGYKYHKGLLMCTLLVGRYKYEEASPNGYLYTKIVAIQNFWKESNLFIDRLKSSYLQGLKILNICIEMKVLVGIFAYSDLNAQILSSPQMFLVFSFFFFFQDIFVLFSFLNS